MKRFALAGNPNCGKTTLFNSLTGSTAHVGNWPGVTVDKKEGTYKKCAEPISIVDLPGIYSLSPYTPEEVISRNYILEEKPDCVINIVDATNLERNLYLTTQIMEIDVPMIIALNMMDTVEKNGDKIDAKSLEEKIGLPVVEISALREKGLDELMQRAYEVCGQPRKGRTVLEGTQLTHLINDCRIALEGSGVENSLFHAVKLVELDEIEVSQHPQAAQMVEEFKKTFKDDVFGTDFEAIVADARYKYISKNYSSVVTKKEKNEKEKLSVSDKADKVLTHKVWGIPIFLVILFLVFHLTFAEDFLFLGAGGVFDKDVVAYLDASATQAVDFAQTPYDKDTTYYTEDGFKKSMLIALSLGVGISIGLSVIRIIYGFSLLYYLIPGYLISLGLSFFVPKIYTAIAFDSGGVASGPLTSSFILPFAVGACAVLCGEQEVLNLAFGIVAMVAMTPVITIQLLGFRAVATAKVKEKIVMRRILDADDEQIIDFT